MINSDDLASPNSTNTSHHFRRNYTTPQFYNPNSRHPNYTNAPLFYTVNHHNSKTQPYNTALVHPNTYYDNAIVNDTQYNNSSNIGNHISLYSNLDPHMKNTIMNYSTSQFANEKGYQMTNNNHTLMNITNNGHNNHHPIENSKIGSEVQLSNIYQLENENETCLVSSNSNSDSNLNAFSTSLNNSGIATVQYPLLRNQPIITTKSTDIIQHQMDSINSIDPVSVSHVIGFENINNPNPNNTNSNHRSNVYDSKSTTDNTVSVMNNNNNNDTNGINAPNHKSIATKNRSSLASILNHDTTSIQGSSSDSNHKPLIIRLKAKPKTNPKDTSKSTSNSISKDKIKHLITNTLAPNERSPIKKASVRKEKGSPNTNLVKSGSRNRRNIENIKHSIIITLKLNNEKFRKLIEDGINDNDEGDYDIRNINEDNDKSSDTNNFNTVNHDHHEQIKTKNNEFQSVEESKIPTFISKPIEEPTGDSNPLKLTKTQNEIITKNNSQINHSKLYKNKQLLDEFPDTQITQLPDGYTHLVMSPNGMLIPVELVNLNPDDKIVSLLRPISGLDNDISICDKGDEVEVNEDNIDDNDDNTDTNIFNNRDKVGTLSLYLLSKEMKCKRKSIMPVTSSIPDSTDLVNHFNRLLEREELEVIKNYKIEKNKLQKLLNDIENSENLLSFENDLLELRDYELVREEISKKYNNDQKYSEYLDYVLELQGLQCLDYSSRLIKFKNYLNMENERLKKNKNRLSKINGNKAHSIWKKFIKSNKKVQGTKITDNNITHFISENDFMSLTNPNSRTYGTYVLNNSVDKGAENQNEIIEALEHFLPENSILRELYNEVKRNDYDPNNNFKHINIVDNNKKKDMISAYGLKEGNIIGGNRLLKELQIDGMNVDIQKNDRTDNRRSVGSRSAKKRNVEDDSFNEMNDDINNDSFELDNTSGTHNSSLGNKKGNNYRNTSRNTSINDIRNFKDNGNNSNSLTVSENESVDPIFQENLSNGSLIQGDKSNSRKELNITSCLDTTLCDVDRVKMLNLNQHDLVMGYTKVFGMPKGLHYEEIDKDLIYLRSHKE